MKRSSGELKRLYDLVEDKESVIQKALPELQRLRGVEQTGGGEVAALRGAEEERVAKEAAMAEVAALRARIERMTEKGA